MHYAASKGGLNGLIKGVALEEAKYNITVNGVEPGSGHTEGIMLQLGQSFQDQAAQRIRSSGWRPQRTSGRRSSSLPRTTRSTSQDRR